MRGSPRSPMTPFFLGAAQRTGAQLRAARAPRGYSGRRPTLLGFVANHFDVVPVRTNDESCIVVRVVVRAETRRTIVFATRLQGRAIESFDLLAILGRERQVKTRRLLLGLA